MSKEVYLWYADYDGGVNGIVFADDYVEANNLVLDSLGRPESFSASDLILKWVGSTRDAVIQTDELEVFI